MYSILQNTSNKCYEKAIAHGNSYKASHNVVVCTRNGRDEKCVLISIDSSSSGVKITLADESDVFFLHTVNITQEDYSVLKSEQGLLVNFPEFSDQIINLLQQCNSGKIFLQLVMDNTSSVSPLEFIERNDFKNLIHLQLKVFPCELEEVLMNITEKLDKYTEQVHSLEKTNDSLDAAVVTLMEDNEALETNHKLEIEHKELCAELECQIMKNVENIRNLDTTIKELINAQIILKSPIRRQYTTAVENLYKEITRLESELKHMKQQNRQTEDELRQKNVEISGMQNNTEVLRWSLRGKMETLSSYEDEIKYLKRDSEMKFEKEVRMNERMKRNSDYIGTIHNLLFRNFYHFNQLKEKYHDVNDTLVALEKDHTKLQEEYEGNVKTAQVLQTQVDEQNIEINKMKNEQQRLGSILKSKDETIAKLKKQLESRDVNEKLKGSEENDSPRTDVITSCIRVKRPLQISNKKGRNFRRHNLPNQTI